MKIFRTDGRDWGSRLASHWRRTLLLAADLHADGAFDGPFAHQHHVPPAAGAGYLVAQGIVTERFKTGSTAARDREALTPLPYQAAGRLQHQFILFLCLGRRGRRCRCRLPGWLGRQGFELSAPFRKQSSDPWPLRSKLLGRLRQIIEPVIGRLAVRFNCQRTWARDLWHLCSRLTRKLLNHPAAVLLNWRQGNPPLQLSLLINS